MLDEHASLHAGAWVCGDPAWDPDFNTADLLLMMPMSRISVRYANISSSVKA